ncbi:MAG: 3-deoxy-manno-octulosonate cytidylyltransferase [Flavobacteriaceae bacterium]|nr:MAG: 3-deoxy-manno-octulosonate cytidylyltransferase [Flavobacteriaceae bacterium]
MKIAIIIPARLASTRLPNKLLLDLGGKSVLERTYLSCQKSGIQDIFLAVDDEILEKEALKFAPKEAVFLTKKTHPSGSDRIYEVAQKIDFDAIVNVQADEPFVDPKLILDIAEALKQGSGMVSAKTPIKKTEEYFSPNCVKVVTDKDGKALYFSRSPIPFCRDEFEALKNAWEKDKEMNIPQNISAFKHLGIYGYQKEVLKTFTETPSTDLEETEKLEQLRILSLGISIQMIETAHSSLGIDTQEDYLRAKALSL